jgi:hypothetical protein
MSDQHVNIIPLGDGVSMKEFFLEPGDNARVPEEQDFPTRKDEEMDSLIKTYYAENFLEVGGRKIPAIHEGTYKLADISMQALEGSFEPNNRFRTAINARRERALGSLVASGGTDGKNVSIRDWDLSNEGVTLIGQQMNYTQFKSTDVAQDASLHGDDPSFPQGATLRDYVVVNGLESRKGTDVLSNLLGAAFIVKATGQDGQDYFLLGRRQQKMSSEGGELSVVGGTPMWESEYFEHDGLVDFAGYMTQLGSDEQGEELLLKPDEIEIGNSVHLLRTLVRVFDPFYTVDVGPNVTVENIAARCYGDASALKEHDRLYALPRTEAALHGLMNSKLGYSVGQGTLAGLHLDLLSSNR